jgi:hypothetical protein
VGVSSTIKSDGVVGIVMMKQRSLKRTTVGVVAKWIVVRVDTQIKRPHQK